MCFKTQIEVFSVLSDPDRCALCVLSDPDRGVRGAGAATQHPEHVAPAAGPAAV